MKKLITLLFISILSLQVYCSAQEILKVDYPAIKEYVTNHNTEFQKLMQRFEEMILYSPGKIMPCYITGIHSHQLTKEVWMIFRISES